MAGGQEADTLAQALAPAAPFGKPPGGGGRRPSRFAGRAVLQPQTAGGHRLRSVAAGHPQGPQVGALLEQLVQAVIDGQVENQKETLLAYVAFLSTSTGGGAREKEGTHGPICNRFPWEFGCVFPGAAKRDTRGSASRQFGGGEAAAVSAMCDAVSRHTSATVTLGAIGSAWGSLCWNRRGRSTL